MSAPLQSPVAESPRLAIVVSHPTQYFSPWFRWLRQREGIPLRVFYLWDAGVKPTHDPHFNRTVAWDVDLLSGYDHEFVPNTSPKPTTEQFSGLQNPGLTGRLSCWKPDVLLLFGYAYRSHLRVLIWAWRTRTPVVFRGDSHVLGRTLPGGLRGVVRRALFRRFAGVTFVGRANREYFLALGIPESRLFFAPHAVDHDRFNPDLTEHRQRADTFRRDLGIAPDTTVVLFAGKLIASKQPLMLLNAFIELSPGNTALVFVGDGAEQTALRARATDSGCLDKTVFFAPFTNQCDMPSRYLIASLFVLPSRGHYETWGLAVHEAMMMGVPCLVSDRVGCQQDLVSDGETGWVFSAEDGASLRSALSRALLDIASRQNALRLAVLQRISRYTYEQTTKGLKQALAASHSP